VTHKALEEVTGTRPFVLSRSCFFGAGSVAAHWTGDNGAMWKELEHSIVTIMNLGFFGMPLVGADICGFNFDTTEELCRRWILVGAFYPFTRSHSDIAATSQELYLWESVSKAGAKVLHWRYRLLPFWYTLHYEAHTTGAPYVRPLFFAFPEDRQTWNINHQFMIGEAILVSPVLTENTTSVHAYFPRGVWHDLFGVTQPVQAGWATLSTPMDAVNVHIRGGTIVPLQEFAMTTTEARHTPFTLMVAFERAPKAAATVTCDADFENAVGHLFVDDDSHIEMKLAAGQASFVRFEAMRNGSLYTLKSFVNESAYAIKAGFVVDSVRVLGMTETPKVVYVNGRVESAVTMKVNSGSPAVEISGINHPLGNEMEIVWSTASAVHESHASC
jgi:alpha-glucosidase (family GH31 glycosyl hydrolase)